MSIYQGFHCLLLSASAGRKVQHWHPPESCILTAAQTSQSPQPTLAGLIAERGTLANRSSVEKDWCPNLSVGNVDFGWNSAPPLPPSQEKICWVLPLLLKLLFVCSLCQPTASLLQFTVIPAVTQQNSPAGFFQTNQPKLSCVPQKSELQQKNHTCHPLCASKPHLEWTETTF